MLCRANQPLIEESEQYDTVRYKYRDDNKLQTIVLPDNAEISYRYDESGRVFQIRLPYNFDDEPAFANLGYYRDGRLKIIQDPGFPDGKFVMYSYEDNGNISEIKSWAGTEIFEYDDNGRLLTWTLNGVTKNYDYDAAGNLTDKEDSEYDCNSANQITNQGFTYDQNGNLTSDGTLIYAFNSENQLVEVRKVSDNSLVATYSYNHDGLRKSKTVYTGQNPSTAEYHWDAMGRLEREQGLFSKSYYYDNSGNLVALGNGVDNYKVHTNLRGDVVSITNEEGGLVARYKYDPWGKVIYKGCNFDFQKQPFRYAGYYFDEETGLYYCNSRYYSPALGRFLTKDSIDYIKYKNPQTLNLYTYCGNNPVRMVDPDGRSTIVGELGVGLEALAELGAAATAVAAAAAAAGAVGGFVLVFSNPSDAGENEDVKWPSTPEEMDERLGFPGERVPDGPTTPGRNKVRWRLSNGTEITYEKHPYDTTAPDYHKEPHWHFDGPGIEHQRYLPGDPYD